MPEYNKKGQRIFSCLRVLEYRGTAEWIQATLKASRIPGQGRFQPSEADPDTYINSGLVDFTPPELKEGIEPTPTTSAPVIPMPPGSAN